MRHDTTALLDRFFAELEQDMTRRGVLVHHGHRLPTSDARAADLVRRGGSLDWVTLSWPSIDMWDLHVGVLVADEVRVGLHVRTGARADLHGIAERLGGTWGEPSISVPAQEKQWNRTLDAENACPAATRLAAFVGEVLRADGLVNDATADT